MGGGGLYSSDAEKGKKIGLYSYNSTGVGKSNGVSVTIGTFFGKGTDSFMGKGQFISYGIGPVAFGVGFSDHKIVSIQVGISYGSSDITAVGFSTGVSNTKPGLGLK